MLLLDRLCQDIHNHSKARDKDSQIVANTQELYFSMPTPIEKILQLVTTKYKQGITQIECQDSILKPTREPLHELPNHRYHLKKMSNNGKQNSK